MSSLEFTNLPLIAVEIRLHALEPILDFAGSNVAQLFSKVTEHRFVAEPSMQREILRTDDRPQTFSGIQQIVAKDADRALSVVFQDSMIRVDWNKFAETPSRPYPRFKNMYLEVEWAIDLVKELSQVAPKFYIVNMTYVNFIPKPTTPSEFDIRDIVSDRFVAFMDQPELQFQEVHARWVAPDGIDRAFQFAEAVSEYNDIKTNGYLLRTVAGKILQNEDPLHALDHCHDELQRLFVEATTEQARKSWGQK